MPVTFIIRPGLVVNIPHGRETVRCSPVLLPNVASRMSSKYTLTSDICAMKVNEVAKKRARSNTDGIGAGSRRGTEKEVHGFDSEFMRDGISPQRANSYTYHNFICQFLVFSQKLT
jgi:hypothetical protein